MKFSDKGLAFTIAFAAIGLGAHLIPLSQILGAADSNFTAFDLMSPIPTAFLGPIAGIAAILISKLTALMATGKAVDLFTFARVLPPIAAGIFFYYYNKKSGLMPKVAHLLIPIAAMALFMLHPAIFGTVAMAYPLYWLIPIAVAFLPNFTIFRALGATFTQHAVGAIIFLYTIPAIQEPNFWIGLIPIVALERFFFALGITGSYKLVALAYDKFNFVLRAGANAPNALPLKKDEEE